MGAVKHVVFAFLNLLWFYQWKQFNDFYLNTALYIGTTLHDIFIFLNAHFLLVYFIFWRLAFDLTWRRTSLFF